MTGQSGDYRPMTGEPIGTINYLNNEGGLSPLPEEDQQQHHPEDVVDEWALLNELDITCYQYEQQRRRMEEDMAKKKVRDDLVNQMREKSNSQAKQREDLDIECKMNEDRLADWNQHEKLRDARHNRRKERNRQLLLRQAEDAAAAKAQRKKHELDEGRQTAAQIREDIHHEKQKMMDERAAAHAEFQETCKENEMLRQMREEQDMEQQRKENLDLDSYFRKKEAEEEDRQRQIADRYNTCRVRETVMAKRIGEIDSDNTFIKKSDSELDQEMAEAGRMFDLKEQQRREELEARKLQTLQNLKDQMTQKEERRNVELNSLLQTVGDMRDAVMEHEKDSKMERAYQAQQKKQYGSMLLRQCKEAQKAKKEFVRGMTPNERRINLPLLEKLRDTCATGTAGRGVATSRTVTPFSERSSTPQLGGQHQQAAKIRKKMKGDTIRFG